MVPSVNWTFTATLKRVVDADTVDLIIDQGFGDTTTRRIRLAGIDAPELVGANRDSGRAAAHALRAMLSNREVTVVTQKDKVDGFTRYIGTLWVTRIAATDPDGANPVYETVNVNEYLLSQGYAVPWVRK